MLVALKEEMNMNQLDYNISQTQQAVVDTNRVLRNTYWLLSMTLLCSALAAGVSMMLDPPRGIALVLMLVGFGLLFWVHKTAESSKGIVAIFAFTACMGAALGPMLNAYLAFAGGPSLIFQALGGTAVVFLGLSGYALTTKKDFSFMRGFLAVGLLLMVIGVVVVIGAGLFGIAMPVFHLALSGIIVLLMSGLILFDTSRIIHGGETNYILATVGLYLSIYNLFTSLLHLLGAFGGDE
jgi:modulator of FtsH protease